MSPQTLITDLLILLIFGAAVYTLLILPRQREFRRRQRFVAQLRPGTRVTTYGGIVGIVKEVHSDEGLVTLEVAEGVNITLLAVAIMGEFNAEGVREGAQRALKD